MKHLFAPSISFLLIVSLISGNSAYGQCAGTTPAEFDCSGCTEATNNGNADATTRCVTSSKSFTSYSVNNGGKLVVCGGATLTVTGSLNLNGGELVINEGAEMIHNSQLSLGGTFQIGIWGTMTRNNNLNINGGAFFVEGNVDMNSNNVSVGNGDVIVREGGSITEINNYSINSNSDICLENQSYLEVNGNFGNDGANKTTFGSASGGACIGWNATTNSFNQTLTASTNITLCQMASGSSIPSGKEGSATVENPCTSCSALILPVELSDLGLSRSHDGIYVDWSTASETNNHYFTIQVSTDGEHFEDVAVVEGQGTKSITSHYHYVLDDVYTDIVYVRLSQTDFDGSISYSGIASLLPSAGYEPQIRAIYSGEQVAIKGVSFAAVSPIEIEIMDVKGAVVSKSNMQPTDGGFVTLTSPSQLASGMYMILAKQGVNAVRTKMMVR